MQNIRVDFWPLSYQAKFKWKFINWITVKIITIFFIIVNMFLSFSFSFALLSISQTHGIFIPSLCLSSSSSRGSVLPSISIIFHFNFRYLQRALKKQLKLCRSEFKSSNKELNKQTLVYQSVSQSASQTVSQVMKEISETMQNRVPRVLKQGTKQTNFGQSVSQSGSMKSLDNRALQYYTKAQITTRHYIYYVDSMFF